MCDCEDAVQHNKPITDPIERFLRNKFSHTQQSKSNEINDVREKECNAHGNSNRNSNSSSDTDKKNVWHQPNKTKQSKTTQSIYCDVNDCNFNSVGAFEFSLLANSSVVAVAASSRYAWLHNK